MILAVFMGVAGFLCAIAITVLGGAALLDIMGYSMPLVAAAAFIVIGLCAVFRGFFKYGEQICNHYIAFKLLALIRDKVFAALRRLCPAKLEVKDKGNLISLITSDIELLEVFYAHTVSPVFIAAIVSVAMTLFIGSFHPLLGGIALLAYLTVGLLLPFVIAKASGDSAQQFRDRAGELSGLVLDSMRGVQEAIQYGVGGRRLQELDACTDMLASYERTQKKKAGLNAAVTNTVIFLFDVAMLVAGALLYMNNSIGIDALVLSVIAMMSSFGPVVALASLGSSLQNTLAAARRVLDILDEEPLVEDVSGREATDFAGASLEHVAFSYDENPVLTDVTLQIDNNTIIGITGPSGSGKSTLLKLLMRFWDTQRGAVKLSGKDIRSVNTADLRQLEGYLTQEAHLFHDSIRKNLLIAKPGATEEEIVAACRKASVHDFIAGLPGGYDTPAGELGGRLSGGERQRIGLARAFLRDAPLILLDEPTSNIDSLNEAMILKSLSDVRDCKSVVLVSHRGSTMKIADAVYSMENGRLA